ncbi:MAG: competence/damage-inducible protein A [Alphaproteobacteria bacterium]|nr:competence/damage-inducible protein A [Alphaproteobacteria bacterium]
MTEERVYTAAVLIIGNEVLSGRTQDANLSYLAVGLSRAGIRLMEARVVRDDEAAIIGALNEVRARYDYVFTTGGIGPTHDDITSESVAKAFGLKLIRHPDAVRLLEAHYRPGDLNEARLRMANTPEGAVLVRNPVSRAPGFQIGNVFVLAGVPLVMQAMFDGIRDRLKGGRPQLSRAVVSTVPEGLLAKGLGEIQARYADLEIGSYPYFRRTGYGTSLVLRGTDQARLEAATEEVRALIRSLGGDPQDEQPG